MFKTGGGRSSATSVQCLPAGRVSLAVFSLLILLAALPVQSQALPPCDQRPGWRGLPRADSRYYCYEEIIVETGAGEMPFTALVFAPDGRLFAARPLYGQVWMLHDTDGDFQPDSPLIVAEGLTTPNALVYHENALYIAAGNSIYRLPDDGTLQTLVDDLPYGAGFWTGGLAIGSDERMYVGIGAPCDFCEWDDPKRGSILSFRLDGTDRQIVAQGFRQPAALTFFNGELYASDTAREGFPADTGYDEINAIIPGKHYGFPYCVGLNNVPDMPSEAFDCSTVTPRLISLPSGSLPVALAAYESDALPGLTGKLLVALAGTDGLADVSGYLIYGIDPDTAAQLAPDVSTLIPYDRITTAGIQPVHHPVFGLIDYGASLLNERGAGVWPHRIYGMAVSPQGWIYFSVGGGKIASLRPM